MSELTNNDYRQILEYYKKSIPKSSILLKMNAERLLAEKLCRCIKKVDNNMVDEARAIGICTKSVVNRKGLTRGKFKCKGKQSITVLKNKNRNKNKTYKKK
jgi:hypothetical protein